MRRVRPPLPLARGGALATATGTAAAALVLLTGGASNAFAGWSPDPSPPSPAQLAAARADCARHAGFPGLPLRVSEARGPFTFEVYADSRTDTTCITGPGFTNDSGWRAASPIDVPAGRLDLSQARTTTHDGQSYGFMAARAGAGLRAATLTVDDGTRVTATIQSGWAVAWWPGSHGVTGAQLTTVSGTRTQTFPRSSCGVHNCAGGPHGGAPGGGPGGG